MSDIKDQYAVFGNPIAHSKSPILQMAFAQQTGETLEYRAQCVEPKKFSQTVDAFFTSGGKGLNITVPFKLDAFDYAERLTERAQKAGAVNTLLIQDEKILGDNTDGIGLVNDISYRLGWELQNKSILILGAGGAVRGILDPLIQCKPASITIANRTIEKAEELSRLFSNNQFSLSTCHFDHLKQPFDIIINGTSASLHGNLPPLPAKICSDKTCCYDMMYGKTKTPFILWAKEHNALSTSDGLGMLVSQGAESFFLWRGVKPETQPVIELVRNQL